MSRRKTILQRFRARGLLIQSEACETLSHLLEEDAINFEDNIQAIFGNFIREKLLKINICTRYDSSTN